MRKPRSARSSDHRILPLIPPLVATIAVMSYFHPGPVLDGQFLYTPEGARDLLEGLGPEKRRLYFYLALADLVFIAFYTPMLMRLGRKALAFAGRDPLGGWGPRLLGFGIPMATAAADYLEATCIFILLRTFPEMPQATLIAITWATPAKWILLFAQLGGLVLVMTARWWGGGRSR